jgi:hypothetical protein
MIIREKQLEEIERKKLLQYYEDLQCFFRQSLPELVGGIDDSNLLARIKDGDQNASRFGIRTDRGRVAYIGLSLAAGTSFYSDGVIAEFLKYPGNDPDAKVEWLLKRVVERLQPQTDNSGGGEKEGEK